MPEVDFAGLRTVAMEAARQPEFREIERRSGRLRRRRRLASAAAAAAAVVLAVAGTGFAVGGFQRGAPDPAATPGPAAVPGKPPSGPVRRVYDAFAGDATHLYAMTQPCDEPPLGHCPMDLYGSDDGGRTWHGRTLPSDADNHSLISVLGPRTVIAWGPTQYVSADGGATWRKLEENGEPVEAVPAGHRALECAAPPPPSNPSTEPHSIGPCAVRVVDPVTGRVAPLAHQPPIVGAYLVGRNVSGLSDPPPEAGLWVAGFDAGSHRPAVAWSRDAGRTWTTHVFTEADPVPSHSPPAAAPTVFTTDGLTAYAMVPNKQDVTRIYRTVDGGATWSMLQEGERAPGFRGYVSRDGAHLLFDDRDRDCDFLASRDGGPYRTEPMTGLPGVPHIPRAMAGGGYLTFVEGFDCGPRGVVEGDLTAVYLSDDGLSWRRIAIE